MLDRNVVLDKDSKLHPQLETDPWQQQILQFQF